MHNKYKTVTTDIFAIDISEWVDGVRDIYLLYSPLADGMCVANSSEINELSDILSGCKSNNKDYKDVIENLRPDYSLLTSLSETPDEFVKMSILPNYKCNFSCQYCYSASGRSNQEIQLSKLIAAFDYFLRPLGERDNKRSLFISGGGEPFLSWEILREGLNYAFENAQKDQICLDIHFITNGSLITDDIISFVKEHKCSICISFEILEDLQNTLRGSYSKVCATIDALLENRISPMINSTITPVSVNRLPEMINHIINRWKGIHTITMEPVTAVEMFSTINDISTFYDSFELNFAEAQKIAIQYGISLNCSYKGISEHVGQRYCPGKLCLNASGTFTICHCASSPKEDRYSKCSYGEIDELNQVRFDLDKYRSLIGVNLYTNDKCVECFAKFNCAGGCMTRNDQYPKEYLEIVCRFTRKMLLKELIDKLNTSYYESFGYSLNDYIKQII